MKARSKIRTKHAETGIALLISIFILLLISVVAIALIVSSGTESALAGNYRSSTGVIGNMLTTYPDNEYATEFGAAPSSSNIQTTPSIWYNAPLNSLSFPG